MSTFEQILEEQRKLIAQDANMEQIVANLHTSGMTILDAVKGVRNLYHLSLKDAQRIVLEHPAWVEESNHVLSINDMASIIAQDPAYFAWIEWFSSGVNGMGMAQITTAQGKQWETDVGRQLRHVAASDKQMQHLMINTLVNQTNYRNEITDALVAIIKACDAYETPVVELALEALSAIGYPQNACAICWLVNLAAHQHVLCRNQAIRILQTIDADAVIPYFLAALVNTNEVSLSRDRMVRGVCEIIRENHEWANACGTAVAYLLGQYAHRPENEPEIAALLAVLDCIHPNDTYAIPVLYHLAFQMQGTAIGQRIVQHLLSYNEDAIMSYSYHLRWLVE